MNTPLAHDARGDNKPMDWQSLDAPFDFSGRRICMTGGTGVLGRPMVEALVRCGAQVAVLARNPARAEERLAALPGPGRARAVAADVLDRGSLERAMEAVSRELGQVDTLINGAGGNHPQASTNPELSFFDLPAAALRQAFDLNLLGTLLACQVFGRLLAERGEGVILNVSSMSAFRPLTRVVAYSAAKAAVNSFTQWLAVHMAQQYSPRIRVNALAPGFFLTEQNRFLLTEAKDGALTARGKSIIEHTPMGRFGNPEDLLGAVLWLLSPSAAFVTGIVLPVDGGFSAFSGV